MNGQALPGAHVPADPAAGGAAGHADPGASNFAQLARIAEKSLAGVLSEIDRLDAEIAVLRARQVPRRAEAVRLRKVIAYLQDAPPAASDTRAKAPSGTTGTNPVGKGVAARVLQHVADRAPQIVTPGDVGRMLDLTASYAGLILRELVGKGDLEQVGVGKYRLPAPALERVAGDG